MRPNKQINSGAHRSGPTVGTGKSRFFSNALPTPMPDHEESTLPEIPESTTHRDPIGKYEGRASVVPQHHDDDELEVAVSAHADPATWVDPLDEDEIDLTHIAIDLRETMMESPPETYYQRHSSRVPGHQ